MPRADFLSPADTFVRRHLGPDEAEIAAMLEALGLSSTEELIAQTVPAGIRMRGELAIPGGRGEHELLAELHATARENRVLRSFIGAGYHATIVPPVIQRNVLENPGWYTQYTPYQPEISQGRLEALLNFQTMVADLTGLPLANASLLDEATAAAEAMSMCHARANRKRSAFFVSARCHPQTLSVVRTRARALGWEVVVGDHADYDPADTRYFGALVQYPTSDGEIVDYAGFAETVHASGALLVVAADLLALTLLRPPGEFGCDIAIGSAQRFGVPMGYGGPHAAFLATRSEYKRELPGRIIGVSKDAAGNRALRMALQTREQHIRRDRATSNICTAQVLLAVMAGMYAVYHGPQGLRAIAERVHAATRVLGAGLLKLGFGIVHANYFDTLRVDTGAGRAAGTVAAALERGINLRPIDERSVGIALDETVTRADLEALLDAFGGGELDLDELAAGVDTELAGPHARRTPYLEHPVFNSYHAEHEMLRYLRRLESRDLSLCTSMIPLGSCTMKLNATSEMLPLSWPEIANLHPFCPADQAAGYRELFRSLEGMLAEITGFDAVSLQPNAGSQGELAGLLAIRGWHASRNDEARNVCLIPVSAHGTNPASAVMAGMRVVAVACDAKGNIDVADLRSKAEAHGEHLGALMVTYPSTHGVFEESIALICEIVHAHGGQIYMDGANMNAQVGLCRPGDFGADVCHLNLHKTFCIPHGGGGPGVGPIAMRSHLAPFMPAHPLAAAGAQDTAGSFGGPGAFGPVAAAPWGSASILTISWVYIALMGGAGLKRASEVAILSANYMAERLAPYVNVLYRGTQGRVGHEFIIDFRPFEKSAGIGVEDVAKRLMDYGFHAPTMSFPVAGTLMIEPTESESKAEIDRLCDALIAIRGEIAEIEAGRMDRADNPLKNAPHTAETIAGADWPHPYSREQAAFPAPWTHEQKFWPSVRRVDNGYGDKNLFCTCPPMEATATDDAAATAPAPQAVGN